jgi:hypothetical protein
MIFHLRRAQVPVLLNPNSASAQPQTEDVQKAARSIGQGVDILHAGNERDIETAFAAMVPARPARCPRPNPQRPRLHARSCQAPVPRS